MPIVKMSYFSCVIFGNYHRILLPKGRKKARKSQKIFRFAHPVRNCAGGTFFYFLYFCGTFHYSLLTSSKSLTLGIARIHSALLSLNRDFHYSLFTIH